MPHLLVLGQGSEAEMRQWQISQSLTCNRYVDPCMTGVQCAPLQDFFYNITCHGKQSHAYHTGPHPRIVNLDPPRCHSHGPFHDFGPAKNAESGLGSETVNQT